MTVLFYTEHQVKFDVLKVDKNPLYVTRIGQGNVLIVLVHGWTCRRSHWAAQLPVLGALAEVLAVDLPGHGDSAATLPDVPSVTGLATTLATVVKDERRGRPVILVGHSMGGAVALEAARQLDDVRAVVLVDTFVIPYGDLPEESAREIEQAFSDDFVAAMQGLIDSNLQEGVPLAARAQLHHDMASADTAWALPLWSDLLRWQPDKSLAHSSGRIVAINGGMIPEVARQRLAAHCVEHVLPQAKHFPQLEMTEAFNDQLVAVVAPLCMDE